MYFLCHNYQIQVQFRIRIRILNLELRIRIQQKVSDLCGSGSTTLVDLDPYSESGPRILIQGQ
jgi:hypothetical protein